MGPVQKGITLTLWGILGLAIVGVLTGKWWLPRLGIVPRSQATAQPPPGGPAGGPAGGPPEIVLLPGGVGPGGPTADGDLPVWFPAAPFALTDQDGQPFTSSDLRGRPWVCGFIFTNCGGVCPMITRTMADLQPKLPAGVHLVSFSVDPDRDTPPVLKAYAKAYKADESRWHFLTGPRATVLDVVRGMKLPFQEAEGNNPILHSEKLLLVDADGVIRGGYDTNRAGEMDRLAADAAKLAAKAPPPLATRPTTRETAAAEGAALTGGTTP